MELSQKFSTLTDGKFFRNELSAHQEEKKNEEEEIEENIEMDTASVHSTGKKENIGPMIQYEPIKESINDSLDGLGKEEIEAKMEEAARSSLYGFGEKLMRRFMQDIERPYSPPIG